MPTRNTTLTPGLDQTRSGEELNAARACQDFQTIGSELTGRSSPSVVCLPKLALVGNRPFRADLFRRLTGPSFECVREGADFLVTEKPRDLRDRQIFIR
jgi:hypothetical protein